MRRRHITFFAGALAAAVLAAGCSSSGTSTVTAVTPATVATTRVTTSTSTAATSDSADGLADLLLADVPDGFVQQPDDVGDTGPSDLTKAARDDGGPDAEQVLRDAGFRRGYQRLWMDDDQTSQIVVFLYEFDDAAGAAAYAQDGLETFASNGFARTTAIDGVPDAHGLSGAKDGLAAVVVVGTKGPMLYQIVTNTEADTVADSLVELARSLTAEQYDKL